MRKRILILGVLMCALGVAFTVAANNLKPKFVVNQEWMENRAPTAVGDFVFDRAESSPIDKATLDTLQPFGIVTRVFRKHDDAFESMLIASDKRESFHSPNVCLPAQGIGITEQRDETITTRTRGTVPVTVAKLEAPDHSSSSWIVFFYRVQDSFIARSSMSIFVLTLAMFKGPLLHANFDMNTVFYRFISMKQGASKEETLHFVSEFLDAAHDKSAGYF